MYEVVTGRQGRFSVKRIFVQRTPAGIKRISFFVSEHDTLGEAREAAARLNSVNLSSNKPPLQH